jgi:transposase
MAGREITAGMIKQIYRLHRQGKGKKTISRELWVSKNTVKKYLAVLEEMSPSSEELLELEDEQFKKQLRPQKQTTEDERYLRLVGQMDYFFQELQRTGVTRWLLWKEYRSKEIHGYSYSQFCWHLQQHAKKQDISLPQDHSPGDLLYIDFA